MIVDFTSVKAKLNRIIDNVFNIELKKRTPLLNHIGEHIQHEGDKGSYETVSHDKKNLEFQNANAGFSFSYEEASRMTFQEIIKKVRMAAQEMAEKMEGGMLQGISKDLEKEGRTIQTAEPFSPEVFLQGLEAIDIDFQDDLRDKPKLPFVVLHPNDMRKLVESDAKMTSEEKQQFELKREQILDKKYKAYLERENLRKLID